MYREFQRVFICAFRAIWVNQLVALPTYFMILMLRYDQTAVTIIFVGFEERTSLLKVSWPTLRE